MGAPEGEERQYRRGETITAQPRPRVLLLGVDDTTLVERLRDKIPTLASSDGLWGVDLHEWDCVVTNEDYTSLRENTEPRQYGYGHDSDEGKKTFTWTQRFPDHISVVYAPISRSAMNSLDVLDFHPPRGEDEDNFPALALVCDEVEGSHISYVDGLPPELTDLVKQRLLPVAQGRTAHTTFEARGERAEGGTELRLRPFLFGPRDAPLAASYERTSEASVWLLPPDIGDLAPWVLAAFREWHTLYPERFPGIPDWTTQSKYRSAAEAQLHRRLETRSQAFEAEVVKYLADKQEIKSLLSNAADEAAQYERALLTAQGDELAHAVARALQDLGFTVRDMDGVWGPEKRREDYRITDPDDTEWLAVGEAKGFSKGVKETGLFSLGRWVAMFAAEEGRLPSAQWYIANQYIREDPDVRPDPLATRSDVLNTFNQAAGLVIDTRALYALLISVHEHPDLAQPVRQHLRERRGVLRAADVEQLLNDLRDPVGP